MGNIFNRDFRDFIEALNHHEAEYILVGDYSVILHGYSRYTGDPDIWVKPSALAEILEFIVSDKGGPLREPIYKVYNNA